MRKAISVLLIVVLLPFISGCPTVDEVMNGLKVADSVAKAAQPILQPVNPQASDILTKVSTDLELIIKTYQDYDTAAGDKPSKAQLMQATATAIQGNLRELLAATGVKNQNLIVIVSTAVAVVNSALTVLLAKLPAPTVTQAKTAGGELPVIGKATKARDLKDAWNNAVKKMYPQSKI
jgi:type IV pilus biogenesis protein CpaD/CtpE